MRIDTWSKGLLIIGFVGTTIAVWIAYHSPATGYELSIYTETPSAFWVLTAMVLISAVAIVFSAPTTVQTNVGILLGGMGMFVVVALPIIRGYRYVGMNDALSHLGTARDMNAGLLSLTESRYPIVHTLGSVIVDITGFEIEHAMSMVVLIFVVNFFVFIPLTIRAFGGTDRAVAIGFFSGLLLLPLNHLSPSIYIHPTSQALLYAPVFLFVFIRLYQWRTVRYSLLFMTLAAMFTLLHPQQAANLVIFFGAIAALQIGTDLAASNKLTYRREWVLPEVVIFAIMFIIWAQNLDAFWSSLERIWAIPFVETQAAESTVTRGLSLEAVGGSLVEVFAKLFLVSLVYAILTILLFVYALRVNSPLTTDPDIDSLLPDGGRNRSIIRFFGVGLIGIAAVFLIYVIGGISDQYFRHLGMLMVFGTIFGAIMLGRVIRRISSIWSDRTARNVITVVVILFLFASLPVIFPSPYIYQSSNHVTEMQMSGYETSFAHQEESILYDDIRSTTSRYGNAVLGREIPSEAFYLDDEPGIPDHFDNQSLPQYYDEPRYIPVPESDRVMDPVLWKGFRFSHEDFAYLDSEPAISRVQSNGGYDLYLVEPTVNSTELEETEAVEGQRHLSS